MKKFISAICIMGLVFHLSAFANYSDIHQLQIYNAFNSGDLESWKKCITEMELQNNENIVQQMELLNFQYGYIGQCIRADKNSEAEEYLHKAETLTDNIEKLKGDEASIYAYRAALLGFKVGLHPAKAPFLGSEIKEYAVKAINLDPNNIMANLTKGNIERRTPASLGGDKQQALTHYKKAIQLFEKQAELTKNNWQYISLLVQLAECYDEMNEPTQSKIICEKILALEPHMVYVRDVLYPKVNNEK